jgi:[CysO sulfur-carrier protein]-S-L-cysteine hydrolase
MESTVRIRREILARMREEVHKSPATECCGLLAGADGVITRIYPAPNSLRSATAYEIAAEDLFRLMREIREASLQLLGIYHSHPRGDNSPSPSDIERAHYPEAAYFILSPRDDAPQPVRAFFICDGRAAELQIQPE